MELSNYHYTTFPSDGLYQDINYIPITTPSTGEALAGAGTHYPLTYWTTGDHQTYPFPFFNYNVNMGLPESDDVSPMPMMMSSSSSILTDDMAVPDMHQLNNLFGYQNGGGLCQFVDDYNCLRFGSADRFKSSSPSSEDNYNWENQCNNKTQGVEESNIKVGRYSAEERKERILRYLKKRNQRNFTKTIKYACRKTLADRRVRVRGRFARNKESSEEETNIKKNVHHSELFSGEPIQLKHDEEDWLQEAMASLMFLPYA